MAFPPTSFVRATSAADQQRQFHLRRLFDERTAQLLQVRPGDKVLVFGSGDGCLARSLSQQVGHGGRVVGVEPLWETWQESMHHAKDAGEADLVDLRHGGVEALPLEEDEWEQFDVVVARFQLHQASDARRTMRDLIRAVRHGGRITLADDDYTALRLWPEPTGWKAGWASYLQATEKLGHDPAIGRKLASILQSSGARLSSNQLVFFGGCAGNFEFQMVAENFAGLILGAREQILNTGAMSANALDLCLREYALWSRRPDAALWYAVHWAEGVRP